MRQFNLARSLIVSMLLISAYATPAFCQERISWEGAWEFTGQVGQAWHESDSAYDDDSLLGGSRIGYNLTDNLALEGNIFAGEVDAGKVAAKSSTAIWSGADVLLHCDRWNDIGLRPFLAAGVGAFSVDGPPDANDTDVIIPYGAGLKYFFNDWFGVRSDLRHVLNTAGGDEMSQLFLSGGITVAFGGKYAEPEMGSGKFSEAERQLRDDKRTSLTLLIEFDFDKADIRPEYQAHLRDVAEFLKKHTETNTTIEGFTDNIGNDQYNKLLSKRRAESVRNFLVEAGVNSAQLSSIGFGEENPIASNDTAEGRQHNRRTVANIVATN